MFHGHKSGRLHRRPASPNSEGLLFVLFLIVGPTVNGCPKTSEFRERGHQWNPEGDNLQGDQDR